MTELGFVTFREAAQMLGVGVPTISKWVQQEKLKEGPPLGSKAKTVLKESLESLQAEPTFRMTLEINQRGKIGRTKQGISIDDSRIANIEKRLETLLNSTKCISTLQDDYKELEDRIAVLEKQYQGSHKVEVTTVPEDIAKPDMPSAVSKTMPETPTEPSQKPIPEVPKPSGKSVMSESVDETKTEEKSTETFKNVECLRTYLQSLGYSLQRKKNKKGERRLMAVRENRYTTLGLEGEIGKLTDVQVREAIQKAVPEEAVSCKEVFATT